jgi:hypothetical protein
VPALRETDSAHLHAFAHEVAHTAQNDASPARGNRQDGADGETVTASRSRCTTYHTIAETPGLSGRHSIDDQADRSEAVSTQVVRRRRVATGTEMGT